MFSVDPSACEDSEVTRLPRVVVGGLSGIASLIKHRAHKGENLYACEHCDKSFTTQSHLSRHIRTHTGEKQYAYKHCDKSFTTQGMWEVFKSIGFLSCMSSNMSTYL